ncbi:MAG TPA: hypothetical protein VIX89_11630 [Bryobacteraceae bacterium]
MLEQGNNEHLSVDEILKILDGEAVPDHATMCPFCIGAIAVARVNDQALKGLPHGPAGKAGPDCLTDFDVARLATGGGSQDEFALAHAATCDWCGRRLKEIVEDLNSELSPEEEQTLDGLASGTAVWQNELASRLAGGRGARRWSSWGWAAVAASLLVGTSVTLWWIGSARTHSVEALLAQAYSERRPFDFRLPDRGYSPMRVERGESSHAERPGALDRAEAEIKSRLAEGSQPRWQRDRGIAKLLDMKPQEAIDSLEAARKQQPDDVEVLTDLAVAYAYRGEAQSRPVDFGVALNLLDRAKRQSPNDALVVFNYALVSEKLLSVEEAIRQWTSYLNLDNSSGWAVEARKHLEDLQSKKKSAGGN